MTFFEPESWHHGSLASKRPENQVSQNFRDSVAKEQALSRACRRGWIFGQNASLCSVPSGRARAKCSLAGLTRLYLTRGLRARGCAHRLGLWLEQQHDT